MNKIAKTLSATVMAGVMVMSLAVSASAACGHGTLVASLRPPYYERVTSHHKHYVGELKQGTTTVVFYEDCDIYTKYGQLYQVCAYCGQTMSVTESSMGTRHSYSK